MTSPLILFVEDDADTRQMYEAAFEFDGFRVASSASAAAALDLALSLKPDAIVTDLNFAGSTDGIGLARRLRSEPQTTGIPVVAVTGQDPQEFRVEDGLFSEILLKPVLPDVLITHIRALVQRSGELRARSEQVRASVPRLLAKSTRLLDASRRLAAATAPVSVPRPCPQCGSPLTWTERREMLGQTFDYYRPCSGGCGMFYYDHGRRAFMPLIQ